MDPRVCNLSLNIVFVLIFIQIFADSLSLKKVDDSASYSYVIARDWQDLQEALSSKEGVAKILRIPSLTEKERESYSVQNHLTIYEHNQQRATFAGRRRTRYEGSSRMDNKEDNADVDDASEEDLVGLPATRVGQHLSNQHLPTPYCSSKLHITGSKSLIFNQLQFLKGCVFKNRY